MKPGWLGIEMKDAAAERARWPEGSPAPRVLHNRRDAPLPPGAVYIGRPSIWGNPFVIGKDGTRAEVIEKFAAYLAADPALMARLPDLRGRDLVCWCAPQACHGDVLLRLANQEP